MNTQADSSRKTDSIQLRHDDPRQVFVQTEDEDRFFVTAAKAALACQMSTQIDEHLQTIKEKSHGLSSRIRQWCQEHPEVERAVAGWRSPMDGSVLVVLLEEGTDEFAMDDAISEFDVELSEDYSEFMVSVVSLPNSRASDYTAYFGQEAACELYAKSATAQGEG